MKVGIYGGSFDPIHVGHLLVAEFCREAASLDEVWFVPASVAPHKTTGASAGAKHRLEMLRLATWGHPEFRVVDLEVERGGTSYTVDTLRHLHEEYPQTQFHLLMGADSLNDFPSWRSPDEICELAKLTVVVRGGVTPPDWSVLKEWVAEDELLAMKQNCVAFPHIELSSSEIRERVGQGRSIRYQVPSGVEQYILSHGIYGATA